MKLRRMMIKGGVFPFFCMRMRMNDIKKGLDMTERYSRDLRMIRRDMYDDTDEIKDEKFIDGSLKSYALRDRFESANECQLRNKVVRGVGIDRADMRDYEAIRYFKFKPANVRRAELDLLLSN